MIRWIQENQFEAYIAILAIFDLFLAISILANVDILAMVNIDFSLVLSGS